MTEESTHIGISGACSWDEEHGWGCVIKGSKVIEVGHSDVAFQPSSHVVEYVDPFEAFNDDYKYKISVPEGGLVFTEKVPKAPRDYVERLLECSEEGGEVPGVLVTLLKVFTNIEADQDPPYSISSLEEVYKIKFDLVQSLKNLLKYHRSEKKNLMMMHNIYKFHVANKQTSEKNIELAKVSLKRCEWLLKHDVSIPECNWDAVHICTNGKDFCPH